MNQTINAFTAGLQPMGQAFWANAAELFIQSTVLIILLLIIDFFLRKRVRAVFRYGLWMLLLVKLLLPVSFTLPTGVGYWLGDYFTPEVVITKSMPPAPEAVPMAVETQPGPIPLEAVPSLEAIAPGEAPVVGVELAPIDWEGLAFLAWLGGMLVLFALLVQRACFVKRLVAQGKAADEPLLTMLDECRCRIGIQERVELRLSDQMLSPAVCGLFRPTILIPSILFERLSPEKLKAVLMHELAHVKRADVWVNLLQTIFQIVYFYNPFIWVANSMIRRAREQAVDEMVLVTLKSETKQYSNTLLDIAEMMLWRPSFSLGLIGVVESKRALERRIRHMLNRPIPKRSNLGICGFLAIVVIGIVVLPMGRNFARERAAHIPATSTINEEGHIVDKTDYPFVSDLDVIGGWKSVDFVRNISDFNPAKKKWRGDLFLNNLVFEEGGSIAGNFLTWTKGLVLRDGTASKYTIKEIDGSMYMFFEWKSGDYTIRHERPSYYVLRKVLAESLKYEPMLGKKALIPPTSRINEQGHIVDKIDYPFVNDPAVIGTWKSVDYVDEMAEFKVRQKKWKHRGGELFLHAMIFAGNGRVVSKNDKVPDGYSMKWSKGLVLSDGRSKKASQYVIKDLDGETYMFYQWKSGDYTFRYAKPSYYVLKKVSSETVIHKPVLGRKAHIPPTSTINEQGHIVDKIDYPFIADSRVIGTWKSVDFIDEIEQFKVNEQQWKGRGGNLFLHEMIFENNGGLISKNGNVPRGYPGTWTKGLVIYDHDTQTASKYTLEDMDGSTYMFYEWKSGDYTFRHSKPSYYVLKKVSSETSTRAPMSGNRTHIPSTSTIGDDGRIIDKMDYPFVNDPELIGTWKSVDFVGEMKQFRVGQKQWGGRGGDLFLKELIFLPNGRTFKSWLTWTKGLVFHSGDKTASKYTLKDMNGSTYMFYEWKSGDYVIRYRKPSYYVLKKVSSDTGGLADAWVSQPSDVEFARLLPARIEQLDIDTADLKQVKAIFGKPAQYIWGKETFTEDKLPRHYILVYPSRFHIYMVEDEIVELRHESGSTYVFRNKLRCGSTLDEAFAVLGPPKETVVGQKNGFAPGILYRDIAGRKGHCYYARSDQNVRLWFSDYKLIAIYMTCSDYHTWVTQRRGYLGIELNDQRWPLVNVIPGMPAAQAGIQDNDKIVKVNDQDMSQITTIRAALAVLKGDPGDKVKLTIQRGEQILDFEVEMTGQLPAKKL